MMMRKMRMMNARSEVRKRRWAREVGLSAMNILLTPGNTGQEYLEILEGGSRR